MPIYEYQCKKCGGVTEALQKFSDAPLTTSGTLTSTDVDNPDNTFTPDTIVGAIGTFTIDAAGAWTFTANSAFDNLNVGDNVSEVFNVTSVDGTAGTVTLGEAISAGGLQFLIDGYTLTADTLTLAGAPASIRCGVRSTLNREKPAMARAHSATVTWPGLAWLAAWILKGCRPAPLSPEGVGRMVRVTSCCCPGSSSVDAEEA